MKYQSFITNKRIILVNIIFLFLVVSCKLDVPIKEMSIAKSTITRAVEVKAEKYAPEELKKAKEDLIKSHDYVRDEDVEGAKKAAEESLKNSNEAILKSLPLLADDSLSEAKEIYEEANKADAEMYAPEEFALAGEKIGEAEGLIDSSEYWESFLKSSEAISHATDARDKALLNISSLQERIENISDEVKNLESLGGRDIAPEEMSAIDTCLEDAASFLGINNLKEALIKITDADSALEEASMKVWKQIAAEKIALAEDMLREIDASQYKSYFLQDLEKAGALLNEGKDLFKKELYFDSNSKSEEAIDILNSIVIGMEKKAEEKRIEEESKAAESKAVESIEYIVKYNPNKRDCLWRIAMYTYKDARLWPLIYMANKDQIKDPDLIFPGQKLIIPPIPKKKILEEMKSDDTDIEEVTEQTEQENEEKIDEGEEPGYDIFDEDSDDDSELDEKIPVETSTFGYFHTAFQPYS